MYRRKWRNTNFTYRIRRRITSNMEGYKGTPIYIDR